MKDGKSVMVLAILFAFIIYVLRNFLGRISSLFFVPIDRLLFISHNVPPTVMWMLLGLLVGLIYGSFIAIKKYRLDYKLLTYPISVLLIIIGLVFITSKVINRWFPKMVGSGEMDLNIRAFNESLQLGIQAVADEEYSSAQHYFEKARKLDKNNTRLDSLAYIYSRTANDKCQLYKRHSQLKYIPNYYYKYAAALTNKAPKICK